MPDVFECWREAPQRVCSGSARFIEMPSEQGGWQLRCRGD